MAMADNNNSKVHYLAVSETTLNRLEAVARPSSRRSECSLRASFRTKSPLVQTNEALLKKITEIETKLSYMESDYKEMKENVEFAASEHAVLGEELKEAQAQLEVERTKWSQEREQYELKLKQLSDEALQRLAAERAATEREQNDRQRDKEKFESLLAEKEETSQSV